MSNIADGGDPRSWSVVRRSCSLHMQREPLFHQRCCCNRVLMAPSTARHQEAAGNSLQRLEMEETAERLKTPPHYATPADSGGAGAASGRKSLKTRDAASTRFWRPIRWRPFAGEQNAVYGGESARDIALENTRSTMISRRYRYQLVDKERWRGNLKVDDPCSSDRR